jgi:DNA-directed RNA polymerase subunit RPC12/RpoP
MKTLSREEYQSMEAIAQHAYHESRIAFLARLWKCTRCGARLPRSGREWKKRFVGFTQGATFFDANVKESGYLCDDCASKREDIDYAGIAKSIRMFRQDILGDDEGR